MIIKNKSMWNPVVISFDDSDDEGLSYIYFDLGNFHYFTLTFNQDEDDYSLEAYTNSDKDILLSSNYNYSGAFMVSENLKEKILENFSLPFLYSLEEWKELNNSDFYWD